MPLYTAPMCRKFPAGAVPDRVRDKPKVAIVDEQTLIHQLKTLGVRAGGVLVVHTAFSRVRPVPGGPEGLIAALRTVVGADGTLVMPSMSDDDDRPFDRVRTPCRALGVVADTFWRLPGVLRSDNPHAFAAVGPHAAAITAPHPLDVPHGPDSPIGRAWALDGQVLLLGVGHDANTTVHLAEHLAGVRYRQPHHVTVLTAAGPLRVEYEEIDHCCENFALLDMWLGDRQRVGTVGHAPARLVRAYDVVDRAVAHLRTDPHIFLHPRHACGECDLAWRSLG